MAQTVKIRLDGPGGLPMTEKVLKTTYPNSSRAPSTSPRCPSTPAIPQTLAVRKNSNCRSTMTQEPKQLRLGYLLDRQGLNMLC